MCCFLLFPFGKATSSLPKKKVWFHIDLCSRNEMKQRKKKEKQQSRGEISLGTRYQTEKHESKFFLFFFNDSFCNP